MISNNGHSDCCASSFSIRHRTARETFDFTWIGREYSQLAAGEDAPATAEIRCRLKVGRDHPGRRIGKEEDALYCLFKGFSNVTISSSLNCAIRRSLVGQTGDGPSRCGAVVDGVQIRNGE